MTSKTTVKTITLTEKQKQLVETPTQGFYIVNRSKPRGHINFNAPDEFGGQKTITVPCVGFPIDLSVRIPSANLMASTEFRGLLSKGYLAIVADEEAERIFKENPAIRKARDRTEGNLAAQVEEEAGTQEIELNAGATDEQKQKAIDPRSEFPRAWRIVQEEESSTHNAGEMLMESLDSLRKEELAWLIENLKDSELTELAMTAVES